MAEIYPYNASIRDRIGNSVYDAATSIGLGGLANRMRNDFNHAIDFVPVASDILSIDDAQRDWNNGNYGGALGGFGLAAIGAVPAVGDVAQKAIKTGLNKSDNIQDLLKAARDRLTAREKIIEDILQSGNNSIRMTGINPSSAAMVGKDMSRPGGYRLTNFQDGVPSGHMEFDSMADALRAALSSNYKPALALLASIASL